MKTDNVFVLVIFLIFASSVLLVLIFGGSTYRRIAEISQDGSDERILLSYVRTKIRTGDVGGSISVENFHGISALSIEENFDERSFVTYIYLHDGWVRELFFENGENFFPDDGTPIV
ncbi:MAG: DUF4860 domain-containing protein, partial [Clostridiales bacterium]|nr:DUF4860 domain-containing protein [Clostridiales bacterium]